MTNRATAAFVFSVIGGAYQMTSLFLAVVVDRSTSFFTYNLGYESLFFTSFIVIWSASHILEEWKGRITWPSIILGLGIASLSTIILSYYGQTSPIFSASNAQSIAANVESGYTALHAGHLHGEKTTAMSVANRSNPSPNSIASRVCTHSVYVQLYT